MGRQFLTGAAVAMIVLLFGLRMEMRLPNPAGPGEEVVEFHGVRVYRAEIPATEVGQHSAIPALATAGTVFVVGMLAGGGISVALARSRSPRGPAGGTGHADS